MLEQIDSPDLYDPYEELDMEDRKRTTNRYKHGEIHKDEKHKEVWEKDIIDEPKRPDDDPPNFNDLY